MPKCGACGWTFSERTLTKHADTACGEEDVKAMSNEIYLLIADTITALKNEEESPNIEQVIEGLADTFKGYDPDFDRVQFLNDCELAVADVKAMSKPRPELDDVIRQIEEDNGVDINV